MYLIKCVPSKDSDQTARLCSLIRVFAGHFVESWESNTSSDWQGRLWSDCMDPQADQASLGTWLFCIITFSQAGVLMILLLNKNLLILLPLNFRNWLSHLCIWTHPLLQIRVWVNKSIWEWQTGSWWGCSSWAVPSRSALFAGYLYW